MFEGHSAVLWQHQIYMWGGKDAAREAVSGSTSAGDIYSSAMYLLRPQEALSGAPSVRLERLVTGQQPPGRAYHTATVHGRYMFVLGGLSTECLGDSAAGPGAEAALREHDASVPVFDLEGRSWHWRRTTGDVPEARCHHTAALIDDCILVYGGYPLIRGGRGEGSEDQQRDQALACYFYDVYELKIPTLQWQRISVAERPRLWGHSCVTYGRDMIVFGGVDVDRNSVCSSIHVWSHAQRGWTNIDPLPQSPACALHSAVLTTVPGADGPKDNADHIRMYIFGGLYLSAKDRARKRLNDMHHFDIQHGIWNFVGEQRGVPPEPRFGHAVVVYDNVIFIIGGSVPATPVADDDGLGDSRADYDLHLFDCQNSCWSRVRLAVDLETEQRGQGPIHTRSNYLPEERRADRGGANLVDYARPNAPQASPDWAAASAAITEASVRARAIRQMTNDASLNLLSSASPGASGAAAGSHAMPSSELLTTTSAGGDPYQIIDSLRKDNEWLRRQLKDHETIQQALARGNYRNPFEVPVYNPQHASLNPQALRSDIIQTAINADRKVNSTSGSRGRAEDVMSNVRRLLEEPQIPRLNINVAEPSCAPGALSKEVQGHLSPAAVSSLVGSTLYNNLPASQSLASRLRQDVSQAPGKTMINVDPMSYLFVTPNAAAAANNMNGSGAQGYLGPQTYDQLLARLGGGVPSSSLMSDGNTAAPGGLSSIPTSLQPLLSLLAMNAKQGDGALNSDANTSLNYRKQQIEVVPLTSESTYNTSLPPTSGSHLSSINGTANAYSLAGGAPSERSRISAAQTPQSTGSANKTMLSTNFIRGV